MWWYSNSLCLKELLKALGTIVKIWLTAISQDQTKKESWDIYWFWLVSLEKHCVWRWCSFNLWWVHVLMVAWKNWGRSCCHHLLAPSGPLQKAEMARKWIGTALQASLFLSPSPLFLPSSLLLNWHGGGEWQEEVSSFWGVVWWSEGSRGEWWSDQKGDHRRMVLIGGGIVFTQI